MNILPTLKLFYMLDNCLYFAIETFSNVNIVIFEKKFHHSFDADCEHVQLYTFSILYSPGKVDSPEFGESSLRTDIVC